MKSNLIIEYKQKQVNLYYADNKTTQKKNSSNLNIWLRIYSEITPTNKKKAKKVLYSIRIVVGS